MSAADLARSRPIRSLTTVFTPPCYSYLRVSDDLDECGPPGMSSIFVNGGYFSPAVCPAGYSSGCGRTTTDSEHKFPVSPDETAVDCVPTGFSCTSTTRDAVSIRTDGSETYVPAIQIRWKESDLSLMDVAPFTTAETTSPSVLLSTTLASSTAPIVGPTEPVPTPASGNGNGNGNDNGSGGPIATGVSVGEPPLSLGAVVGIVLGGALAILLVMIGLFLLFRHRKPDPAIITFDAATASSGKEEATVPYGAQVPPASFTTSATGAGRPGSSRRYHYDDWTPPQPAADYKTIPAVRSTVSPIVDAGRPPASHHLPPHSPASFDDHANQMMRFWGPTQPHPTQQHLAAGVGSGDHAGAGGISVGDADAGPLRQPPRPFAERQYQAYNPYLHSNASFGSQAAPAELDATDMVVRASTPAQSPSTPAPSARLPLSRSQSSQLASQSQSSQPHHPGNESRQPSPWPMR